MDFIDIKSVSKKTKKGKTYAIYQSLKKTIHVQINILKTTRFTSIGRDDENLANEYLLVKYLEFIKIALRTINSLTKTDQSKLYVYEMIVDICNEEIENILCGSSDITYFLHKDPFTSSNLHKKFLYYPPLLNKNFSSIIAKKREFNINQPLPPSKNTKSYRGFKKSAVQKFAKNFISPSTPYNGVLLWHEVGVGKTCAAIGIAENFKNQILDPSDKIIILTPGDTLKESWYDEIFNVKKEITRGNYNKQCTGDAYTSIVKAKTFKSYKKLKRRRTKLVEQYYSIMGYQKFANFFKDKEEGYFKELDDIDKKIYYKHLIQYIKRTYSNRIFILDEVQYTREGGSNLKGEGKKVRIYLELIARYAVNTKFILLSATPLYDKPIEIVWLINLLLLNDNRAPVNDKDIFKNDLDIKDDQIDYFKDKIRGYISYRRGEDPNVFPMKLWPSILEEQKKNLFIPNTPDCLIRSWASSDTKKSNGKELAELFKNTTDQKKSSVKRKLLTIVRKKISTEEIYSSVFSSDTNFISKNFSDNVKDVVIYRSYMGSYQYEIYKDLPKKIGFDIIPRQISNFAFPGLGSDDSTKGSLKNLFSRKKGGKYTLKSSGLQPDGKSILHCDHLIDYSSKMANIVNIVKKSEGIVFIYSQFKEYGAEILALILEENGFNRFNCDSNGHVLKRQNLSNRDTPRFKKNGFQMNYILLTGDTNKKILNKLKDYSNDKKNKDGHVINVIIGTQVIEQGISFFNVRQIHIMEPWYNISSQDQVIGRGCRRFSHKHLPPQKRNVTIYLHTSVVPLTAPKKEQKIRLIEERMYSTSLHKYRAIAKVQRIMKESAIDCHLNKKANVFTKKQNPEGDFDKFSVQVDSNGNMRYIPYSDIDGSLRCDFGYCDYTCDGGDLDITEINKDTYDLSTLDDDILIGKELIKNVFESNFVSDISDLTRRIKPIILTTQKPGGRSDIYVEKIIYKSLERIISHRELIYNSITGKFGYLRRVKHHGTEHYMYQPCPGGECDSLDKISTQNKTIPIKYRYLPSEKIRTHLYLEDFAIGDEIVTEAVAGDKDLDNYLRDELKLLMCTLLFTHWEEAFDALKLAGVQDIYNKFIATYSEVKNSKGLYIEPKKKYNINMCSYKYKTPPKNNKTKWNRILKERSLKLYGKGSGAAGSYLKKANTIVNIKKTPSDIYRLAEIIKPIQVINSNTKLKVRFLDEKKTTEIAVTTRDGSYRIDYKNPSNNFITGGFYFGKDGLPNVYDMVYNGLLTQLENLPETELHDILRHVFMKIHDRDISTLIVTNKNLDFFNLTPTNLDKIIISIIFYSYFSDLTTHPYMKFSFFLTEKMHNIANGEGTGGNTIKALIIPTSSKKSRTKRTRVGKDGYLLYSIHDGNLIEKVLKPNIAFSEYFNRTFFPSPSIDNKLRSDIYGFMHMKDDSGEFYVVLKEIIDATRVTKMGKKSRKSDRTGAPCGGALGVTSKIEISRVCNLLLEKITGNTALKKYNYASKKKVYLPSIINLCSELKFLLRYTDHIGLVDKSSGKKLDTTTRYFYHSSVKSKIDRLIEDRED